jgi:hypothetical protein
VLVLVQAQVREQGPAREQERVQLQDPRTRMSSLS